MNGEELKQFHEEDNLLLVFVKNNGLKKKRWKENYLQVMKTLKYYIFDIIALSEVSINWTLVKPDNYWE